MWLARRVGPLILSRPTDANLACLFVKKTCLFSWLRKLDPPFLLVTIHACPVDSSLSGRPKLSAVGKGFSTRIPSISLSTTVSLDCTGPTSPAGLYSGEEPPTLDLVPLTLVPLRRTSSNKYHQHIDDIAADDIQLGKVNCLILCKKSAKCLRPSLHISLHRVVCSLFS